MKCLLCGNYSFYHICKTCQLTYIKPSFYKDKVGDIEVISFYKYDDIKELLHTKYEHIGSSILNIIAKNSILKFTREFEYNYNLLAIPIDDRVNHKDYSHSAILAKYTKSKTIKPYYNRLKSQNSTKYAKHTVEYKLQNPRDFIYTGKSDINVILVDDVVTDGITINEAKATLSKYNVDVEFAIALTYSKAKTF